MKASSAACALLAALALSGCQTVVLSSRKDPAIGKLNLGRALAIVNFSGYGDPDEVRRTGEMELVNSLPELNLVPSYRDFTLEELASLGEVKRRASAEGFDGLVLLWVNEVRVRRNWYDGFAPEGANSWTDVRISAAIVSVAGGREDWIGVIERRGDEGTKKDVRAIVHAVARKLRSESLVDGR